MNSTIINGRIIKSYHIHELVEYINWIYFFHAWQFPPKFAAVAKIHNCMSCRASWFSSFSAEERQRAVEAAKLYDDAKNMLNELDSRFSVKGLFQLFSANSENDDIIIYDDSKEDVGFAESIMMRLPFLRQQMPDETGVCLCLSDFIRPLSMNEKDNIGVFATTVDSDMETSYLDDDFLRLLVQTLADRLAEAAAERLHEEVRKVYWGYAPDENLAIDDLMVEKYQGIRPAVGYPCMPDISFNFLIDDLIGLSSIGIHLTEHGMMSPHASVSGLMISLPESKYFAVGKISEEQLKDYSKRRGKDFSTMKSYVVRNLVE